jgi:hypothetical protein
MIRIRWHVNWRGRSQAAIIEIGGIILISSSVFMISSLLISRPSVHVWSGVEDGCSLIEPSQLIQGITLAIPGLCQGGIHPDGGIVSIQSPFVLALIVKGIGPVQPGRGAAS